jgi:hypothetical protein
MAQGSIAHAAGIIESQSVGLAVASGVIGTVPFQSGTFVAVIVMFVALTLAGARPPCFGSNLGYTIQPNSRLVAGGNLHGTGSYQVSHGLVLIALNGAGGHRKLSIINSLLMP